MAYALHDKFVMSGTIGSGADQDIWSCSINGRLQSGSATAGDYDAWLSGVDAPLRSWFANANSGMRNDAQLTNIKLNPIGTNGLYADPTHPHSRNVTATSGGNAPITPGFVMNAISWRTDSGSRYAAKGRIYLPTSTGPGAGGDRTPTAQCLLLANAGATLVNLLAATYGGSHYFLPEVFSKHAGEQGKIISVRVGDVLDVQRRRKNKLREAYTNNTTAIA